jgi:formamidopyrimidine-DNA glycosylase
VPELPEVETIRRGLEPACLGRTLRSVLVREPRLRWPVDPALPQRAEGRRIEQLARRGKYLILGLDSGDRLLIHLGMSGRIRLLETPLAPQRHDHLDLVLDTGVILRYHDPRRFGALLWWPADQDSHPLLAHLGPEPFDPGFNGAYLHRLARGRNLALKAFLMDGKVVVGCGNIYAAEALHLARLRPARPAGSLSRAAWERLAGAVREVLEAAVQQGGTTLRDFAGAHGESGYFQQVLKVYGRQGQPCHGCGGALAGIRIGNRASVYCPRCQR